jgi:hypothetical protein
MEIECSFGTDERVGGMPARCKECGKVVAKLGEEECGSKTVNCRKDTLE